MITITLTMPIFFFINLAWHKNKKTKGKVIKSGWRANAIVNLPWKKAITARVIPHNGQGILKILYNGQGTNVTNKAKQPTNNKCISIVFITFLFMTHQILVYTFSIPHILNDCQYNLYYIC